MVREEVEMCPHCGNENVVNWDVEKDGFVIRCGECGKEMMLCDACYHSDDNPQQRCDGCVVNGKWKCFRGIHD